MQCNAFFEEGKPPYCAILKISCLSRKKYFGANEITFYWLTIAKRISTDIRRTRTYLTVRSLVYETTWRHFIRNLKKYMQMLRGAQNFRLMSFFVHSPLIPWHHLLEYNTQTHQNDWCMISKCCDMIGARYIP